MVIKHIFLFLNNNNEKNVWVPKVGKIHWAAQNNSLYLSDYLKSISFFKNINV